MNGFSFRLKGNSVENIIRKNGYCKSEIFYSPIMIWWIFWALIFFGLFPFGFELIYYYFSYFSFKIGMKYILGYLIISYAIISFFNRNFALTDKKLLVVNSHLPFNELQYFNFNQIQEVKISSDWRLRIFMIFGLFSSNYIQVKTKFQNKRFYCLFLDVDCYDENFTEKTLDDLATRLLSKGVKVKMEI